MSKRRQNKSKNKGLDSNLKEEDVESQKLNFEQPKKQILLSDLLKKNGLSFNESTKN
jgi:hypothetical protein